MKRVFPRDLTRARKGRAFKPGLVRAHVRQRERGQSLVEISLLLPVLLIMMVLAVDLGRLYFAYVTVTNAARTGADYGSLSPANATDTAGIEAAVYQDTTSLSVDPSVSSTTGTDANGNTFSRVTVEYSFDPLFDFPGLPDSIDLTRSVQMRVVP